MVKKRKMQELLNRRRTCKGCSYYRSGYCNDLDVHISDYEPVCSDENYYA